MLKKLFIIGHCAHTKEQDVTIHLIQKFHLFSIQLIPSSNLKKCMMMIEQIALQALRLSRSSRKTLYIHFIMNSARIGADDSLRSSQ